MRMQWKNKKKNTFVAENARGSHFFCNLHPISEQMLIGEMLEWLKRHAWKACIRQKRIGGSNPPYSAGKPLQVFCSGFFCKRNWFVAVVENGSVDN